MGAGFYRWIWVFLVVTFWCDVCLVEVLGLLVCGAFWLVILVVSFWFDFALGVGFEVVVIWVCVSGFL